MSPAEDLYHLQEVEIQIVRSRKRIQEIAAMLANNETVNAAREQVTSAENTLNPLLTKARDIDLEMQTTKKKAQDAEQRLYSGAVKNPKEMQEIQQEITALNKRYAELETTVLETMMLAEEAEAALQTARHDLETVTSDWESDHQQLLEEKSKLEVQVPPLLDKRRGQLAAIAPDDLKIYEALKQKKGGRAVAVMEGNSCQACFVEQNRAIEREVRQGQKLVYCGNCGRILVNKL